MNDFDEDEQADVLAAFDDYIKDMELPFQNPTFNAATIKCMYKAFAAGYKFGVYK